MPLWIANEILSESNIEKQVDLISLLIDASLVILKKRKKTF